MVVSEYTGSHEVLEHGVTGYVVKGSGSPEEIAALLDGPLADPETRAAIGARASEVAARFDYESVYPRFREAHRKAHELRLMRGRRAARRTEGARRGGEENGEIGAGRRSAEGR